MTSTPEEFRKEVRHWLESRFALRDRGADDERVDIISHVRGDHRGFVERARRFQQDLAAAGYVGLSISEEYGGRGLGPAYESVLAEEMEAFDTPSLRPLSIGLHLVAPTILRAGTAEQKRRYLPPLLAGEQQWCQLFSEPEAGSDLASLRTRAVADGDSWVVRGQKVWSSYASDAHYGILLARTDPQARPQAGITMFVLDMQSAGVQVRPLTDIAGGRHFNEVWLDDVVIPEGDVLGRVHGGWDVATGTLGGERGGYLGGSGGGRRHRQVVAALGGAPSVASRHRAVRIVAAERVLEWLSERVRSGAVASGHPASGSLVKLAAGNLEQAAAETVVDLLGPGAGAWDATREGDGDRPAFSLAASRQATIAGGTHQIQRNLAAERLLGLPREPKPPSPGGARQS